ncbi:unnamed protein product [Tilletia controversa]|uniref:HMG box domain-containing protein n=3 Tax=Tilletia TaxID=13289 RepID=A0A8X7MZI2_9BASI|nr:hypothetical protein CF328_g4774 [Tilletia controversa]KAE8255774.1 hypothetical protein A4X06_0g265 [Tilletia controversa]CAD6900998.1 unnamed protein product [Tilletia controversa]CAD6939086.1 unnamed protein product [Tilletia controversa]CAD6971088.1 unnamed protein product [Tilletia controversa]
MTITISRPSTTQSGTAYGTDHLLAAHFPSLAAPGMPRETSTEQTLLSPAELLSFQNDPFRELSLPHPDPLVAGRLWPSPWPANDDQDRHPALSVSPSSGSHRHNSTLATDRCDAASSRASICHTPRPSNAWILYRAAKSNEFAKGKGGQRSVTNTGPRSKQANGRPGQREGPGKGALTRTFAEMWRHERADVRRWYEELAEQKKIEHKQQYPDYRYQPRRNRATCAKDEPAVDRQRAKRCPPQINGASLCRYPAEEHRPRAANLLTAPDSQLQSMTLSAPAGVVPPSSMAPQLHGSSSGLGAVPSEFQAESACSSWSFPSAGIAAHIVPGGGWHNLEDYPTLYSSQHIIPDTHLSVQSAGASTVTFFNNDLRATPSTTLRENDTSWDGAAGSGSAGSRSAATGIWSYRI